MNAAFSSIIMAQCTQYGRFAQRCCRNDLCVCVCVLNWRCTVLLPLAARVIAKRNAHGHDALLSMGWAVDVPVNSQGTVNYPGMLGGSVYQLRQSRQIVRLETALYSFWFLLVWTHNHWLFCVRVCSRSSRGLQAIAKIQSINYGMCDGFLCCCLLPSVTGNDRFTKCLVLVQKEYYVKLGSSWQTYPSHARTHPAHFDANACCRLAFQLINWNGELLSHILEIMHAVLYQTERPCRILIDCMNTYTRRVRVYVVYRLRQQQHIQFSLNNIVYFLLGKISKAKERTLLMRDRDKQTRTANNWTCICSCDMMVLAATALIVAVFDAGHVIARCIYMNWVH